MPLLIRFIAQRLIFVAFTSLTVLGLSPQVDINPQNPETDEVIFEEEKSLLDQIKFPLPKFNILNPPKEEAPTPITTEPEETPAPPKQSFITVPRPDPVAPPTSTTNKPVTETRPEPKVTTAPIQTPAPTPTPAPDNSVISSIENVSVNILCLRQVGNRISLTNGSGVLISDKGVVLTNSHVAQYFLLKDAGYECSIRRENIPLYGFTAKPLYISENWIENNSKQITNTTPTGTGKYDYALLYITGSTNPVIPLPSFPSLKINTTSKFLDKGDTITVAGYPGKITYSLEVAKNAELLSDKVSIKDIFTLGNNTVDVVATSDTNVAQRGSSGGGAFKNNELGGIIVSTNQGSSASKFVVNILTLDYINREIKNETGKSLSSFLSGDLMKQVTDFEIVAKPLVELLMRNL